jgi:hypothetical protein
MATNITTKEQARTLLKNIDYLQMFRLTERLGIRWGSMRIAKGLFPPMGILCRKIIRAHCKNVFPTSDIKILSRGIRVDFPSSMQELVKLLYVQRLYNINDAQRRADLMRVPEISALINSAQVLVRSSNSIIETDAYGSYVLFRCNDQEIDRAAVQATTGVGSKSGTMLLLDRINMVNSFKTYLAEFSESMRDAERKMEEARKAEEERQMRENAAIIDEARRVASALQGFSTVDTEVPLILATAWMNQNIVVRETRE